MSGVVIIAVTIVSCVAGYVINANYASKYQEPAVIWPVFAAQAFFVLCMLFTWPNPEPTTWFIIWTILTLLSYVGAFVMCKQHAVSQNAAQKDVWLAIIAQFVLPLGVAIVVLILIAMVLGVFGGGKKKRR